MKRMFFTVYVVAVGCGLALSLSAASDAKEKIVYSFGSSGTDGIGPNGDLIEVHGILNGTTGYGGANCKSSGGCGTVFAVDPSTGSETVLYSFCSVDYPICTDGQAPRAGLIDVNGTLYGTTAGGGTNCQGSGECGTVFSVNSSSRSETVIYSFCRQKHCADGALPLAKLIDVNGTLYGTTDGGGANCQGSGGCGTVFALNPSNGKEKVLYSFCSQHDCSDGSEPMAGMIEVKGTLYGTTVSGGTNPCLGYGCGTVFALDVKTGAETVVHSFGSSVADGTFPFAGLINVNGTLYGTTQQGGSSADKRSCYYGCGTVFSLNPGTGIETVLYAFCNQQPIRTNQKACTDGADPYTGVIDVKGTLYGATLNAGDYGSGILFSLDLNTDAETVLHAFGRGTDGVGPWGPLTDTTGTLYGVTNGGGANGDGTVFKLRP